MENTGRNITLLNHGSVQCEPAFVVDKQGNFYRYLTRNSSKPKRADFELALLLYKYYDDIRDDASGWYKKAFE